ncbi:peptidyl-prolyl cis-trans isomerase [Paenibacillus sp. LHD-117]|uniref:peptidylprolyl isomerase n=1 Tax=Paenibacillus sp. LHD-117 TaxID=3071412 RepID=UPI0027E0FC58|nr:peptidyl-prolyl cis-trans isomerase [Paenibacillus sp. LHD-117]MDQ6420702.1 peptidyl-prolyl cis-trans isomerase [Paenibacillus sp. LHD-117]
MRRVEVLKAVVILQAICLIALTGAVIVKMWPQAFGRGNEQADSVPPKDRDGDEAVATVGGKEITRQKLTEELYKQYGDAVLRTLMLREAMDREAAAKDIKVTQEELDRELAASAEGYESEERFFTVMKEQLGLSREQVLDDMRYRLLLENITAATVPISDAEVTAYIEEHPEQFAPKSEYHLRWIVTDTRELADEVIEKLEGGDEFSELAKSYSLDEFTKESGGDLGFIEADDPFYDSGMLAEAGLLSIGETAGPIAMESGYAVIQLMGQKSTAGLAGQRLQDVVRKQLALERAKPMTEIEDELLVRYDAVIVK